MLLIDGNTLFSEVAGMATSYGYFDDAAPAYVVGIAIRLRTLLNGSVCANHDFVHVHLQGDELRQAMMQFKFSLPAIRLL